MAEHVEKYIEQTTLSRFPFIQRLNTAYIKAFLHGSDWFRLLSQIESYFDPTQSLFLFNELDPKASAYSGQACLPIFAYAVERKDLVGLQMFADLYRLGEAEYRYGDRLYQDVLEATDPIYNVYTDEGYTTDMTGFSYPVMVLFLDYSYNTSVGIDLLPDVWSRFQQGANFVSFIKPARTPLILLRRPNFILSRFTHEKLTLDQFPDWEALDSLSSIQRGSVYTSVESIAPEKYWSKLVYHDNDKRIWWVFSDTPISTITILSGVEGQPDLLIQPDWDSEIFQPSEETEISINFNKYCCRLCLNLSSDSEKDTFLEVVNGR